MGGQGEKSLPCACKDEFPVSYKHPNQPAHTQTHAMSALPSMDRTDRRTDCLVVNLHITQEHPSLLGSLSPSLSPSPQDCRMADPHKPSPEQSAGLLSEQATSTASFGKELCASVIYCAIKIFPLVCPKPAV